MNTTSKILLVVLCVLFVWLATTFEVVAIILTFAVVMAVVITLILEGVAKLYTWHIKKKGSKYFKD